MYNLEVHGTHLYQAGAFGMQVYSAVPACVGWVRTQAIAEERLLMDGVSSELLRLPGYQTRVFHRAFTRQGDELVDVIHSVGNDCGGRIKQVAYLNGESDDGIMSMIENLPIDFN